MIMILKKNLKMQKKILDKLMNPEITLKDSLKAYEDGISKLKSAQKLLEEAELKIHEMQTN